MASIGLISPAQNTSSAGSTTSSSSNNTQASTAAADPLANQSTFLNLLVAQLKNQNPMNPMDGTTFVTQLAQFSDLEQNLAMRQDLDTLTSKYAPSTDTSTSQTSSSTDSSGSTDVSGSTTQS